jgi:hypothetical protein
VKAVGVALDDLDLVAHPLQFAGVDGVVTMVVSCSSGEVPASWQTCSMRGDLPIPGAFLKASLLYAAALRFYLFRILSMTLPKAATTLNWSKRIRT